MRPAERRRRVACAAAIALGLCGCGARIAPRPHVAAVGSIVTDVVGLRLADAPGAAPARVALGSPALVLERRSGEDAAAWYRLLAADGSYGWWFGEPVSALPARAAAGPRGAELLAPFPSDAGPDEEVGSIAVAPRAQGVIAGASRSARVASLRQLQLPESSNPFNTPWLTLRFGEREGYAPPSRVRLEWSPSGSAAGSGPLDALARWKIAGLARAPFLSPVEEPLRAALPAPGSTCLTLPHDGSTPARMPLPSIDWSDVDAVIHLPGGGPASPAALLFLGAGPHALWVLLAPAQRAACARLEAERPIPVSYATADLDGDGLPEWVVETVALYGDGYTSALWVVGGRSLVDSLALRQIPLGGSSGEPGGTRVDGSWRVERQPSREVLWVQQGEHARAERMPYP